MAIAAAPSIADAFTDLVTELHERYGG